MVFFHVTLAIPPEISSAGGNQNRFTGWRAGFAELFSVNDGELFAGKLIFVQANSRAISGLIRAFGGQSTGGKPPNHPRRPLPPPETAREKCEGGMGVTAGGASLESHQGMVRRNAPGDDRDFQAALVVQFVF